MKFLWTRWSNPHLWDAQVVVIRMIILLWTGWSTRTRRRYLDTFQVEPVWIKAVRVGKGFWIPVRYFKHIKSLLFDKKAGNENKSACQSQPIQLQEIGIDLFETCAGYTSSRWRWFALATPFPQSGTYFNSGPELGYVLIVGKEPQMTTDI